MATQIYVSAADRSRPQVFQSAGIACFRHLCELVGRISRFCRRDAVPESNQWSDVRSPDRKLVVEVWIDRAIACCGTAEQVAGKMRDGQKDVPQGLKSLG